MPRQARLDAPGTLHHVIVRGIEKRRIVDNRKDRENFVKRMGEIALESATTIYERILGSGEFVERITKEADERVKYQLSGYERRQKAESHIKMICQREGINVEELKSGSRRAGVPRVRSNLALWLVEDCWIPLAEAGRQLGVSASAVSKIIRRRNNNSI